MDSDRFWSRVEDLAAEYRRLAEADLADRWSAWKLDLSKAEVHEVIGGLLARQVTLATHLVAAPPIWTHDLGPILLRAMADVHVTLAWILEDPETRARAFIAWGLGQAKLELEQRKAWAAAKGKEIDELMKGLEEWIDSQRWSFLTEVDLGSWTGKKTRDMAKEVGLEDFYEHVYQPFSAATDSTWRHIQRFNLQPCDRVLHRYHLLPFVPRNGGGSNVPPARCQVP